MTKGETRVNLPWVEKYRPNALDELVSHEDIISTISKFIRDDQVPHLLFYGPPGTGKTSTILACARQLYTPKQFSSMVLELNASDDRGIGIVRGQILTFASTRTIFKSGFKLIILDEADAMTMDAQNALRRSVLYVTNMSDSEEEYIERQVKIVFLGDTNIGKTSIVRRFCQDEFTRQHNPTAGADFYTKHLVFPGRQNVTVVVTDVGGQELSGSMLDKYLYNINIIVLVYDITNASSFDSLPLWVDAVSNLIVRPTLTAVLGNKFIEKYTENIRFCIICNYLSKIIPALQSRCTRFRFAPLAPEQILPRLDHVIEQEKLNVTEDGKEALLRLANGDMRKVLNVLQSTWLAFKLVNEDNVYTCVGHPLKNDIENIVNWLLNDDFKITYQNIKQLKTIKGLALADIITEVHRYVHRIEFPFDILIQLLDKMAEIEHRLATGTNENIQLTALIAAFQHVKDISVDQ